MKNDLRSLDLGARNAVVHEIADALERRQVARVAILALVEEGVLSHYSRKRDDIVTRKLNLPLAEEPVLGSPK